MLRIVTLFTLLLSFTTSTMAADKIKVMHLNGQSNKYHSWKGTGDAINQHLKSADIFEVDVVTSPAGGEDMGKFSPKFSDYDVIVLNYDGAEWSEKTKKAFVKYVRNGGGVVTIHGANNSFAYWSEFNEIIGLGGWGGPELYDPPLYQGQADKQASRNEDWGPRVYWQGCGLVHDDSPGSTKHPPKHDFIMTNRTPDHPIMHGLPEMWLQSHDEVYSDLRGPGKNLTILATAYADQKLKNASPHNEPMLFTVSYGKGRVFQTTLGHVGARDDASVLAVRNVGFITTLQRGVEWAATGDVTQAIPEDFPTAYEATVR
jgi:type 1 glutamine amidotransferase